MKEFIQTALRSCPRSQILIAFLLINFTAITASADPRTQYGWGLHDLATVGSDRTGSGDAMTIVQNPASMVNEPVAAWNFNLVGMSFSFPDLNNVVVDDTNLGASSTQTGNVSVRPDSLYLMQLGAIAPFGVDKSWRVGFTMSLPVDKMVDVETKDGYRPSMAFFGKPEARLTSVFGIAKRLSEVVSLGIGGQFYFKTGATLNVRLPQSPSTSTVSFGATVKLAVAPQIGADFQVGKELELNLGYLGARDYRQEVAASNLLYLLGPGNAGVLVLNTAGSNYYDPETYSFGLKFNFDHLETAIANRRGTQLLFGGDYERWSPYDGSVAKITFSTFQGQFVQNPNNLAFRDIFVPRIGMVWGEALRMRMGYSYRVSPLIDLNGATNELDADRHIIGAGASFNIGTLGIFETPAKMDLGAQVQLLVPRTVNKTDPNAIGAPGYTVSGSAYFYGLGISHDI